MTAIVALATATLARPEGPVPSKLENGLRDACTGAWRACEMVLAGPELRTQTTDPALHQAIDELLAVANVPLDHDVVAALRAARTAGALGGAFDLDAVAAACARAGDSPANAVHRRRVRSQVLATLRRELGAYGALANRLDGPLGALLIDVARALFRLAVKDDQTLARWAMPPTGTTNRERAFTVFAAVAAGDALAKLLERAGATVGDVGEPTPAAAGVDGAAPPSAPGAPMGFGDADSKRLVVAVDGAPRTAESVTEQSAHEVDAPVSTPVAAPSPAQDHAVVAAAPESAVAAFRPTTDSASNPSATAAPIEAAATLGPSQARRRSLVVTLLIVVGLAVAAAVLLLR
jgi:hypothetical protein